MDKIKLNGNAKWMKLMKTLTISFLQIKMLLYYTEGGHNKWLLKAISGASSLGHCFEISCLAECSSCV